MRPKEAIKLLMELRDSHTRAYGGALDAAINALNKADPTCGGCAAGIRLTENTPGRSHVERCDECDLFASDEDAAGAVEGLLDVLHKVYRKRYHLDSLTDTSVAGALEYIEKQALGE